MKERKRVWNVSACEAAGRLAVAVEAVLSRFERSDDSTLKMLRKAMREYDNEIMRMAPIRVARKTKRAA